MDENFELYSCLLQANREAFVKELFKVAYHALSGAMYVALNLQDAMRMTEVERVAREQWQTLKTHNPRAYPSNEPSYTTLYAELIQLADSRRSLLRNNSLA